MKKIFEFKTLKGVIIKNLIEVVKQYIKETNLYISSEGVKISSIDSSKNSFTFIKLEADKFESFECTEKCVVGVNIEYLYKSIKHCDRKEVLSMYILENDDDFLYLEITNPIVGKSRVYKIQRLSLDNDDNFNVENIQFDYVINIPTFQFQKIIKDMGILGGKIVEIKSIGKQLIFECNDGIVQSTTRLNEIQEGCEENNEYDLSDKSIKFEQTNNKIVQGKFKLVCLMDFIKSSQLCDNMNLLLANDKPLVLEYNIANLGILRLLLVPYVE